MTFARPEDWPRVKALFEQALALPADERAVLLARECGEDGELRAAVEELLRAEAVEDDFLEPPDPGALPDDPAPVVEGNRIGPFTILRRIAVGGMGVVYEAEQETPSRRVAIKLLRAGFASADAVRRFRYEVDVLGRLRHPGIAQVFEAGVWVEGAGAGERETPWFAMELVEGARDVVTWADESGASRSARLELFRDLCDAVQHGHHRGVLHRDIKPTNVLVDGDGRVKLIDFSIARGIDDATELTRTGSLIGTPQYMAPEQLSPSESGLDVRCDVYALGALLYRLLCGRTAFDFEGKSLTQIALMVREAEPVRPKLAVPELESDLEWILLKALERDPARRYDSVAGLLEDLRRHSANEPVLAGPPSRAYRVAKFVRRNRALVAVVAALIVGTVTAVVGVTLGLFEARASEQEALREAGKNEIVIGLVADLFDGIEDTVDGREVKVIDLLDAAVLDFDADVARDPDVEFEFRSLLGATYVRLGKGDAAIAQLERATALLDRDAAHPTIERALVTRGWLGEAWAKSGKPQDGDALMHSARDAALGMPKIHLEITAMIARTLRNKREYDELLVEAAKLAEEAAGLGDTSLELQALTFRAQSLTGLDRHGEAVPIYEEVWRQREQLHGSEAPSTVTAFFNYATALTESGQSERALELYPGLLDTLRRVRGPTHAETLTVLNNHAASLAALGRFAESAELFAEVVAAYDATGGSPQLTHIIAITNLGQTLTKARRLDEATPHLKRALDLATELLAADDLNIALFRLNYGANLAWRLKLEEGEPHLLEAWGEIEAALPPGHSIREKALHTLTDAYRDNGHHEESARWRARLDEEHP